MTTLTTPPQRRTASRWLRPALIANLVCQVGIVLTGGVVRLSGSGLGCPTWPECTPGSYTPVVNQAEGWHKQVEFGNRLLTYVLAVAALAAAVLVWRHVSAGFGGRRLRVLGVLPFAGIPLQAVIGGISVLTDLNPWVVMLHLLLSMAMIALSTWLLLGVDRTLATPSLSPVRPEIRRLALVTAAVTAVVLVLGTIVTGSGPHSGDADVTHRFGFDPRTVSWLHADVVLVFVGLVLALALALRLTGAAAPVQRRSWVLLGVTAAQGAVGYTQYFTGVPAVLVAVHMLGAGLLVVATTSAVEGVLKA